MYSAVAARSPGLPSTWGRFYAFAPAPTLLPRLCLPACNVPPLSLPAAAPSRTGASPGHPQHPRQRRFVPPRYRQGLRGSRPRDTEKPCMAQIFLGTCGALAAYFLFFLIDSNDRDRDGVGRSQPGVPPGPAWHQVAATLGRAGSDPAGGAGGCRGAARSPAVLLPRGGRGGGRPAERSIPAPRCGNSRGYGDSFIIHLKCFKQGGYLNDNRGVVRELFC